MGLRSDRSRPLGVPRSAPARPKEAAQQFAGLLGEHASDKFHAMVEPGILHEILQAPGHAGLGVRRAEHEPRYPGQNRGAGAVGAGLQGGVQGAALQAPVSETTSRVPNGQRLGVGGRIAVLDGPIVGLRDDFATAGDQRADRDLSAKRSGPCKLQCPSHPGTVDIRAAWGAGDAAQCAMTCFANEAGPTRR